MAFEGGFAGVLLLINTVVFLIILICILLYMCLRNDHDAASKKFISLYHKVFQYSIKEVVTNNGKGYLFGGYSEPTGRSHQCGLHIYYLANLWLLLNWFIFIFIDNAFYRKVTSCSDPFTHTDDAFVCFDVEKSAITEKTIIESTEEKQ